MDHGLGTSVRSSDDHHIGRIDRLILDPATCVVKAVVIHKGLLLPYDVKISVDDLDSDRRDACHLSCTAARVNRLPPFDEAAYIAPLPTGYPLPSSDDGMMDDGPLGGYGPALSLLTGGRPPTVRDGWAGAGMGDAYRERTETQRRRDVENAVIGAGALVQGRDGAMVGTVHHLTFNPHDGALTRVVMHRSSLFAHERDLPVALIARADDGVIYLTVDATAVTA